MPTTYLFADESGNLDYDIDNKEGATGYFGFGTARYDHARGDDLWEGFQLRVEHEKLGVNLTRGFHAKDDSWRTKNAVFELIKKQGPRFDFTFLYKPSARPYVREQGSPYLYKLAWYLHFKYVLRGVPAGREVVVVAGTIGSAAQRKAARKALNDVCDQFPRQVQLCVWDSSTHWGLQVADYGLWAAHRDLTRPDFFQYREYIKPTVVSRFTPWGKAPVAE